MINQTLSYCYPEALPPLLIEYFYEWSACPIWVGLGQLTLLIISFNYVSIMNYISLLSLWLFSYFIQWTIKSPRPYPQCISPMSGPYGLPSSEHVYLISTIVFMYIYFRAWRGYKSWVFFIHTAIIYATSCISCQFSGLCSFPQNVLTIVLGTVFPIVFNGLLWLTLPLRDAFVRNVKWLHKLYPDLSKDKRVKR